MAGGYYGIGDAAGDIGHLLGGYFAKQDQEEKDKGYLDWLTAQTQSKPTFTSLPPPPTIPPPGQAAIQGPALPQGMAEPDPSVAPTDGLPGGAPYSNKYLTDPNSLVDAEKKKADAATQDIFKDPAKTMNLLIEAKKRGVGEDLGSVMDFIAKEHQTASARQYQSDEKAKALKERVDTETTRNALRLKMQLNQEHFQETQNKIANATRLKIAGMRGKKGPLDAADVAAMSPDDLDALSATLDNQESNIEDPVPPKDEYDTVGIMDYRQQLKDASNMRMNIYKLKSAVERAQAMKKPDAPITAPRATSQGTAVTAPRRKGIYNPATGSIEYK